MTRVQTISVTVLALALIGAVTLLTWHGSIDGQAAVGFLSGLGIGGGAVGAAKIGSSSGPVPLIGEKLDVLQPRSSSGSGSADASLGS